MNKNQQSRITTKEKIKDAALKLFTENGVRATTTKSIAEYANVSEPLIFRYFISKEGLVIEVLKQGYKQAGELAKQLFHVADDTSYLMYTIAMPLLLVDKDPDFWKMQYNIIALNEIANKHHQQFLTPSKHRIIHIFKSNGIEDYENEALLFWILIDGLWKSYAAKQLSKSNMESIIEKIQSSYKHKLKPYDKVFI